MNFLGLSKNYNTIFNTFLSYLPSRLLVVLNSLIIIPILAHMLSAKELGIFQLSIGVLNLVCTCSSDWISKSALRFYEKYRYSDRLDEFFSNIIWLALAVYAVIILGFFLFADFAVEKFFIPKTVLLLTLFVVIPCGIRQFLYQMLRILNKPFLYSFSIIIYQMSFLALFLLFTGFLPNVHAVLFGMAAAMFVIDIFILQQVGLKIKLLANVNCEMLFESLKYALPQIITNSSIWAILNINKYVFQYNQYFTETATVGVSFYFITSILTPILSTFSFAIFPFIIKKYESKSRIKPYVTSAIQLYCGIFIPIILLFCFYSQNVANLAFGDKYPQTSLVIPFFAISLFMHELMKLFNIKYHLQNKTYIEMAITFFAGLLALNLNFFLIGKFHIIGAGIAMLLSIVLLFTLNFIIQFKNLEYANYKAILKTVIFSAVICGISYLFVELLFLPLNFVYANIIKLLLYIFICYSLSITGAQKLFR